MSGAPERAGSISGRCLLVFSKPPIPGRVKTRLLAVLSAERAAELHAAFLDDLLARLAEVRGMTVLVAWALDASEEPPPSPLPAVRQRGVDLGERLYAALADAAGDHALVAAVGSDLPELAIARLEEAFAALAAGADVALGPTADGGYYLIAVRRGALSPRLFAEVPWSTDRVLAATLERCGELGLETVLVTEGVDVDTPADLERLAVALLDPATPPCPRTASLLTRWGMMRSHQLPPVAS